MARLLSVKDMHDLIEQDVHRLGFYAYDDLETEEIDLQINRQIFKLIDGILDKNFGRTPKIGPTEGFQVSQVSLDNLRKQHVRGEVPTLSAITGGYKFDLPEQYYHYVKASVTVTYTCNENGQTVTKTLYPKVRIVETQNVDSMKVHPFHKTNKKSPLAELVNNSVYIYNDSTFTITAASLDYIKKPAIIKYGKVDGVYDEGESAHCDLDDSLHYLIVEMTSLRIMKTLESPQQKIENIQQETI